MSGDVTEGTYSEAYYPDTNYGFATYSEDGTTYGPFWTYIYATQAELTLTESVKADNPIGIDFSGPSQATVNITSPYAPVILAGNIANPAGATTITAARITQTESATITSKNLTLDATGGVGTASQPLNASLTANGVLNVEAGIQGVYLNLTMGPLGVIDSGGDVVLNATGSLDTASGLPGGPSTSPEPISRSIRRRARLVIGGRPLG